MREARVRQLRFITLQIVGAIAVLHIVVGGSGLARIADAGLLGRYLTETVTQNPRPLLFVLSGLGITGGMIAAGRGRLAYRLAYKLGLLILTGYLLGWVGWHTVLDHGYLLRGGTPETLADHSHLGLIDTFQSHYLDPIVATVFASTQGTPGTGRVLLGVFSVSLELIGIVLLGILLRVDPAVQRAADPNPFQRFDQAEKRDGTSQTETETD
jgi:hypothetical protein